MKVTLGVFICLWILSLTLSMLVGLSEMVKLTQVCTVREGPGSTIKLYHICPKSGVHRCIYKNMSDIVLAVPHLLLCKCSTHVVP